MQWNGKRIFNTRGGYLQKRNADTLLLTDWLCLGSILFFCICGFSVCRSDRYV